MTLANVAKLLAAAAALAVAVVAMSPPTQPVAGPVADWRKEIPVKTGMAPPASVTGVVPASALSRPPPLVRAPAAPATVEEEPSGPADRDSGPSADDEAAARRFHQGYRWAERNDVEDPRYCFTEPGDPFIAGCMARLREANDDRGHYSYESWREAWRR